MMSGIRTGMKTPGCGGLSATSNRARRSRELTTYLLPINHQYQCRLQHHCQRYHPLKSHLQGCPWFPKRNQKHPQHQQDVPDAISLPSNAPTSTAFTSIGALNSVIARGYLESPTWSVPDIPKDIKLAIQPAIYGEEICKGVVHPITKETITKYEKLINDPALSDVWTEAMCRELDRLAQGSDNVEGTDTEEFLTLDNIRNISADRKVTYARIVVNYRPHKPNEPNRMRLTVGGNFIEYPGELTTCTADLTTTKIMWNSGIITERVQGA